MKQREIKFRAWDAEKSKMKDVVGMTWVKNGLVLHFRTDSTEGHLVPTNAEHYKLMQFTGLKDKNGKEIYEGDIVCFRAYDEEGYNIIEEQIHSIEFDVAAFFFGGVGIYEWVTESGKLPFEVIGNCFENPELIK